MKAGIRIGVDIGGTFTDVVCCAPGGKLKYLKLSTTRHDESQAVLRSIVQMAETWGIESTDVVRFAHGTTVATNAVLERKGARIGLLTTRGFRDQLEIGRQMRHQMYEVNLDPETPSFLIPGSRRKEVDERLAPDGSILVALDETGMLQAVEELVSDGVQAIAVCFLFSFRNPLHERRARELIQRKHPDLQVSLSHEVDPTFREYERVVVTAFDAYVKPVIDRYLHRLEGGLTQAGIAAPLQVMQSRGGLMASWVARHRPVRLFLSGPAAGVIGGQLAGQSAGIDDLITVDIGGTSCDIALIRRGKAMLRAEASIDGYPVRVPMMDVSTIGAGGGSIGRIDRGGRLLVGPHSAGSEPGPACYARGGTEPTVTDASIVLGYINPNYFAGGVLTLDPDLAWNAVNERIAKPMGLTVEQAALGMHRVMNAQMAEAIRLISIRQGCDPRPFSILPMGGGGGLHAVALARSLGISTVVIPPFPGVLSAIGLLSAPVEHEVSSYFGKPFADTKGDDVRKAMETLDTRCAELMANERLDDQEVRIRHFADVCFVGQSYTLEVPFDLAVETRLDRMYEDFLGVHDRVRGHAARMPAAIVNLRAVHVAGGSDWSYPVEQVQAGSVRPSTRRIVVEGSEGRVDAAILIRSTLPAGITFTGPAIVEQPDTTILIEPGWNGTVDRLHNMILNRQQN